MSSLRNRIAVSCALLLIGTVASVSFVSTVFFRAVLFDERKQLIDQKAIDIVSYIKKHGVPKSVDPWSSTVTFVQINGRSKSGKIIQLVRSSQLGSHYIPIDFTLEIRPPGNQRYQELIAADKQFLQTDMLVTPYPRRIGVHVVSSLSDLDVILDRTQIFVFFVTVLAIPFIMLISILLSRRAVRPINELISTMKQVTSDKLDQHFVLVTRTDELRTLARTFDEMLHRLHASFERERRFIADASHELKTPLTVINANAQMLRRWAQSNEEVRRESIEVIIAESKHLTLFIEEMLLLARIDSGDTVAQEPVDILGLCRELVRGIQARVNEKAISVRLDHPDDTQCFTTWGNAILLRRIFSNLLDNALKFTLEGEIVVTVARLADTLEIVVRDTGIGIPPDELEQVFDRLYRTDHSRTRQVEGFGLGLAIARAFVHLHRGNMYAKSSPGSGTSVYVQLPFNESSKK